MHSAHIDSCRLLKLLFWWLVVPLLCAVVGDVVFALRPWLTVITSAIAIPLASLIVIRVALSEFDKVIQIVAPEPPDGMPNDAVPNDAVPNDAVPNDAVPNDAVPNDAVPNDAVLNDAVPNDAMAAVDNEAQHSAELTAVCEQ